MAVVILSVGAPEDLRGAVLSLLAQDPQPAEIVVVNSGGGDAVATVQGLLPESAVIHSEELLRHGAARNRGISATRAPYVAFLSADCRALPGWIAGRQRLHGEGHSVVASAVVNRSPGRWSATAAHAVLFSRRMPGTPPQETLRFGCSYERALFDRFGFFDEELIGNEDSDFNSRLEAADIELVWAPDVRTAHPHPTTARVLLADQYRRGRRMAEWRQGVQGIPAASVARDTVARIPSDVNRAWRSAEPGDRSRLALSAPLIAAAATAYAIGAGSATRTRVRRPRRQQRFRLIAMLSFRNEMRFLPDYFANISPHVDGIIALDDGSTDGSADFVARQPNVIRLLSHPPHGDEEWDDAANHRELVEASWAFGPTWLLGLDADERVEHTFRERAERIIRQSDVWAYAIHTHELWDSPVHYRSDGIWGHKHPVRLFESRQDHEFDMRRLHGHWAPLNARVNGGFAFADLNMYHLRMMDAADRDARRRRYMTLDPQRQYQTIGYEYLTDEAGIELSPIPADRRYEPLPR